MESYKVSVVIPTYNRPELLRKCLYSLTSQVFNNDDYEIIVVSDGPDLLTEDVVLELSREASVAILYSPLQEKKGPAAARNKGWRSAQGELVVFTDDDCLASPYLLKAYWDAYCEFNKLRIAFTGKVSVPVSDHPTDFELNTSRLSTAEFVTANCALTQLALYQTGGFDESFKMAWREDSDLHFKLIAAAIPIVQVPSAMIIHPVRPAKWGVSLKEQKKGIYDVLLYKKFPKMFRERIYREPFWNYYRCVLFAILSICFIIADLKTPALAFAAIWLLCSIHFAWMRLRRTDHSLSHITEMVVTSLCIPFLSLYWKCYGAFRYKAWYL